MNVKKIKTHSRFNTVFSFEKRYIKIMQLCLVCMWICIGGNKTFFCSHFFFSTIIHEIIKQQQQFHILHCFLCMPHELHNSSCLLSLIWQYKLCNTPLPTDPKTSKKYLCVWSRLTMHQYRELWCKRLLLLLLGEMQNNSMTCAARKAKIIRRGSSEEK